jgi:two-component system chemotaxis response regulator CheB
MAEVKVVTRWRAAAPPVVGSALKPQPGRRVQLVAIGASTGGPRVIAEILAGLAPGLTASVLIVQHMAPGFSDGFAQWLGARTGLPAGLAQPDAPLVPGRLYLAPDELQMGVTRDGRIALRPAPARGGFCPSASELFESVAAAYGRSAMGIVLTGMGRDGADGLLQLRRAGGVTIAQDAESCVVFGMPKEAIALGAVDSVLRPDQIAAAIRSMAG